MSGSSWVRRRSSTGVRSAPPPNQARDGHDEARVHVHRRHVRIVQMGDQRDSRGPEARIGFRAGDLLAECRREFAVHRRAMDADLLEHAARASWTSRRRRPGRRCGRSAAMVCARSGPASAGPSGHPSAVRPPAPRRPRRCRRAGSRTRHGQRALRASSVAASGRGVKWSAFRSRSRFLRWSIGLFAAPPRQAPWLPPSPR